MHVTTIDSPLGRIRIFASDDGVTGVFLPGQEAAWPTGALEAACQPGAPADPDHPVLAQAARQLREYFAGKRRDFDVSVQASGTDFQLTVWQALSGIRFGATRTYGQVAATIGRPKASRAVGAANSRNPVSIIVPCHRVVGSSGELTGYAGGLSAKQWLLRHESGLPIA